MKSEEAQQQYQAKKHVWNEDTKIRILFLDDDENRIPLLRSKEEVVYVRSFDEFCSWLQLNGTPDVISFDHDLEPGHYDTDGTVFQERTGATCAKWAVEHKFLPKLAIVHSWNWSGANNIFSILKTAGVTTVTKMFNPRLPHLWT